MKVKEIMKLNCDNKEQMKELISLFKSIEYVEKNVESLSDENNVEKVCSYIVDKMKFKRGAIFWRPEYKTSCLIDEKSNEMYTVYARTIKEMFIKMATFAYYYRKGKGGKK